MNPISSKSTNGLWETYQEREAAPVNMSSIDPKVDTEAAEEEVVSLWYLSSIKSLQAVPSNKGGGNQAINVQANQKEQSRFQKIRAWLRSWFGGGKESEVAAQPEVSSADKNTPAGLPGSPQLQSPEFMSNERLSKAIADLNKDLLYRLKDTAEFAEEMRKSNSRAMDHLILFHITSKSMDQKKLKEETGLEAHEHIFYLQKLNKELQQKHYRLLDDIHATSKTNSILHWVNTGTTAGIVGTMAVGFATGGTGAVFAIALSALNVLKGGLSGAEGILKYRNDRRTGEMTMVNSEMKSNRNHINDKINFTLPNADQDISNLLKTVRHHLENYSKEARINPQSSF